MTSIEFFDDVKGVNGVRRITIPKSSHIPIGSRVRVVVELIR